MSESSRRRLPRAARPRARGGRAASTRRRSSASSPATPQWRVHDVLAHLVGVPDDVVHGRMDGLASDAWTQAQVDARAGRVAPASCSPSGTSTARSSRRCSRRPRPRSPARRSSTRPRTSTICATRSAWPARATATRSSSGWDWIVEARTRDGAPAICFVVEAGEQVSGVGESSPASRRPGSSCSARVAGRRTAGEIDAATAGTATPMPSLLLAADFFSIPERSIGE